MELNKLMKVRTSPKAADAPFASTQKKYSESFNNWIDNTSKGNPVMRNMAARMLADLTNKTSIKLPVRPEKVVLDPERNVLPEIRQ